MGLGVAAPGAAGGSRFSSWELSGGEEGKATEEGPPDESSSGHASGRLGFQLDLQEGRYGHALLQRHPEAEVACGGKRAQ